MWISCEEANGDETISVDVLEVRPVGRSVNPAGPVNSVPPVEPVCPEEPFQHVLPVRPISPIRQLMAVHPLNRIRQMDQHEQRRREDPYCPMIPTRPNRSLQNQGCNDGYKKYSILFVPAKHGNPLRTENISDWLAILKIGTINLNEVRPLGVSAVYLDDQYVAYFEASPSLQPRLDACLNHENYPSLSFQFNEQHFGKERNRHVFLAGDINKHGCMTAVLYRNFLPVCSSRQCSPEREVLSDRSRCEQEGKGLARKSR
ncbi:unnamed protein product [Caenorhabditis sp. 36 PRJEB53466]|nr:unnamed protein product [Caenorhabditis sp. 36 PRJEB53466]